jgi:hypothetical protein
MVTEKANQLPELQNGSGFMKILLVSNMYPSKKYPHYGIFVENTEKVSQPPIRKNIEVLCGADCLFNHNKHCSANGITVQTCDNVACPNCCTYQPK